MFTHRWDQVEIMIDQAEVELDGAVICVSGSPEFSVQLRFEGPRTGARQALSIGLAVPKDAVVRLHVEGSLARSWRIVESGLNQLYEVIPDHSPVCQVSLEVRGAESGCRLVSAALREEALSPVSVEVFTLDRYAQRDLHLYSLGNFAPLLEDLFLRLAPRHIVEIGSELGKNSRFLNTVAGRSGGRHTIVDTSPVVDEALATLENTNYFTGKSVDYLAQAPASDLYVIDGDHNYQTVEEELRLISARWTQGSPLCIVLHDVGWPTAFRDVYYDSAALGVDPSAVTFARGPIPYCDRPVDCGFAATESYLSCRMEEGGERNGVLAAVRDFMGASGLPWQFVKVPSIHGLGVLWLEEGYSPDQREALVAFSAWASRAHAFLSNLELNRIDLLIARQRESVILQDYSDLVEYFRGRAEVLQGEASHYREEAARREEELRAVRGEVSQYRDEAARREEELRAVRGEVSRYRDEVTLQETKLCALRAEAGQYRNEVARQKEELHALRGELGTMRRLLDSDQAEVRLMRSFYDGASSFWLERQRELQSRHAWLERMNMRSRKWFRLPPLNGIPPALTEEAWTLAKSGLFAGGFYLRTNPDVAAAGYDPLLHFCEFGWKEGRDPSEHFSVSYYLNRNPDVRVANINPLLHYVLFGRAEGRQPILVNGRAGEADRERIAQTDRDLETTRSRFDAAFYLEACPDVKAAGVDPLFHYFHKGWRELRDPSPAFSTRAYLKRFPSLWEANVNPLLHSINNPGTEEEVLDVLDDFYEDSLVECSCDSTDIKLIAFYLPQFHRVAENDAWWGEGFTDWTSCKRASPLFAGHWEPRKPHPDIGYYNLLDVATLKKQAEIAGRHGVYGFCFYYYNFSGKRILEKPLDLLLEHPEIDIKFCLCWANENWSRRWDGSDHEILLKQLYRPGDDQLVIEDMARYIRDPRYVRFEGKPVVMVYRKAHLQDPLKTTRIWRDYCRANGIGELYLVAVQTYQDYSDPTKCGFDAASEMPAHLYGAGLSVNATPADVRGDTRGTYHSYRAYVDGIIAHRKRESSRYPLFRTVLSKFDNTGRKPRAPHVFTQYSPDLFHAWLTDTIGHARRELPIGSRFVFVNAWNEWAEGTYLEPDLRYGYTLLNTVSRCLLGVEPVAWRKNAVSPLTPESTLWLDRSFDRTDILMAREPRIAVHLHVFHGDLLPRIFANLAHIPYSYDLFVTVGRPELQFEVERQVRVQSNIAAHEVFVTPNRGRDIAPLLVCVGARVLEHDVLLHLHTKKSDNSWFDYLLRRTLGDPTSVHRIVNELLNEGRTGVVYPQTYPRWRRCEDLGGNKEAVAALCGKYGLPMPEGQELHFPSGSFYWAKPDALRPLLQDAWRFEDFPEEPIPADGTIAHAVERIITLMSRSRGYRAVATALTTDQTTYPSLSHGTPNGWYEEWAYDRFTDLFQRELDKGYLKTAVFDIFDTLLTRPFTAPEDLFTYLLPEIEAIAGRAIPGFCEARIAVDSARRARLPPGHDVTIDAIYEDLAGKCSLTSAQAEAIKHLEMETELELFGPKATGLTMLRAAREKGLRVVLVSDMYLPRDLVRKALEKVGVGAIGYDRLIVSSEDGWRKDTGETYRELVRAGDLCPNSTIVVGDSLHSDVRLPAGMGFQTLYAPRDMARLRHWYLKAQLRSISLRPSSITHHGVLAEKLYSASDHRGKSLLNAQPYNAGYVFLGPLLYESARHFLRLSEEHSVRTLHFLTREGVIMKAAFDLVANHGGERVKSRLLYASRVLTNCLSVSEPADLLRIVDNNAHMNGSLAHFFAGRYNYRLTVDDWRLLESQGVTDRTYIFPKDKPLVTSAVQALSPKLLLAMKEGAALYREYVNSEITDYSALADIGYSGTIQDNISRILSRDLLGFYLMAFSRAPNAANKVSLLSTLLHDAPEIERKFFAVSFLYEALMMPPMNSVVGVERKNGEFTPLFDDAPVSDGERAFRERVAAGALDFVRDVCSRFRRLPEFDFESVVWDFMEFCENPRLIDDVLAFRDLSIDDKYTGAEVYRFLGEEGPRSGHFQQGLKLMAKRKALDKRFLE